MGTLLRLSVGVDGELARLAPRARRLARRLPGVTKRQRRHESPQRMIRRMTPSPNSEPVLVRESSSPMWGLKGFSDEEATQCRADCWLASAG